MFHNFANCDKLDLTPVVLTPQRHQLAYDLHSKFCFHILDHFLLLDLSG